MSRKKRTKKIFKSNGFEKEIVIFSIPNKGLRKSYFRVYQPEGWVDQTVEGCYSSKAKAFQALEEKYQLLESEYPQNGCDYYTKSGKGFLDDPPHLSWFRLEMEEELFDDLGEPLS